MIVVVFVAIGLMVVILIVGSVIKSNSMNKIDSMVKLESQPEEMATPVYRPFKDGPFHMTMGLQSLDVHEWIQIDPIYRYQLEYKQKLFNGTRRNDVFVYREEAHDSCLEVLEMLIDYLPRQFPNMFETNRSKTKIHNRITGQSFDVTKGTSMHPLEVASLLVQEDLVIMQRHSNEDTYHANALAVCFPSGWSPKVKLGLPLASIHMPHVPFFQEKLRLSMDRYFLKLKEENPVQRLNWTLQIGNELCQTTEDRTTLITRENASKLMYLRTERQTLRRLPKSKTILFTIKTYMTAIEDVCQDDPNMAKRLAGAIRNWPPELVAYKGANRYKDGLLEYLDMLSSPLTLT